MAQENPTERFLRLQNLPTIPKVVMNINQLVKDGATFEQLTPLLETEPTLALKVLKAARSAMYAARYDIKTLPDAINVIGTNGVMAVANISYIKTHFNNLSPATCTLNQWWIYITLVSAAAQLIVNKYNINAKGIDPALAAVFPHLAEAIMLNVMHDDVAKAIYAAKTFDDRLKIERQEFETNHIEVSTTLLIRWKLPDEYINVALSYHLPSEKPSELSEAIAYAVELAQHAPNCPQYWGDREKKLGEPEELLIAELMERFEILHQNFGV